MTQSAKRFAQLLQESINAIADHTGKPKGVIRDELGYAIGRKGGSAIEYWAYGDGHIPKQQEEVAALARALVEMGRLDCEWLTAFFESAGYANGQSLVADLFPNTVEQPSHNLPLAPTSFVGRSHELAALAALIANPDCRLITLTGPGGSGKTRLAIEVARNAHTTFAAGATFVALAPLTAAELVASTTAKALNFTLTGQTDPQTQLLQYLRRQTRLLVLDNIEHLLPSPEQLLHGVAANPALTLIRSILTQAPMVMLLVTSRERLNLQGEWIYDVGGLETPDNDNVVSADEYSAVTLFLQTARRVQASFAPTAADQAAVVRICRLVAGVPLALELAAAWVRMLSCHEIGQEIAASLSFLTSTMHDLPERHRSLRAVFDHSWRLLSRDEQQVFARCAIFRGGFTREAAEQVAGTSLSVLAALVDKSLLSRNTEGRYQVHELARQYGEERLAETGEVAQTRNRHLTFFMALAEEAEPRLRSGPQIVQWYEQIEREHDNLRAALNWSLTDGEFEPGLRIVGALWEFWMIRGYADQGCRQAERFLAQPEAATPTGTRAKVLHTAGVLAFYQGRFAAAHAWLNEGIILSRTLGDSGKPVLGMLLVAHGYTSAGSNDFAATQVLSQESLTLGDEVQDQWISAHALNQLGLVACHYGNHSMAQRYFYEAFTGFQADGQSVMRGIALLHIGSTLFEASDYAAAEAYLWQSLTIFEEVEDTTRSTHAFRLLSDLFLAQNRLAEAQELLTKALSLGRKVAVTRNLIRTLDSLGRLARRQGNYRRADNLHRDSLTLNLEIGHQVHLADSLERFACLAAAQGQAKRAALLFGAAEVSCAAAAEQVTLVSNMQDPERRAEHEQLLSQVRADLGEAAFAVAWAAGTAMTVDHAVAYALEPTLTAV